MTIRQLAKARTARSATLPGAFLRLPPRREAVPGLEFRGRAVVGGRCGRPGERFRGHLANLVRTFAQYSPTAVTEQVMATSGNPMGTDGFEFVEYTAPDPSELRSLFARMGFPAVARHRSRNVTLHRQGDINFIINAEPGSFAQRFASEHGGSICAMAFRVKDAAFAYKRALELGAKAGPQSVGSRLPVQVECHAHVLIEPRNTIT